MGYSIDLAMDRFSLRPGTVEDARRACVEKLGVPESCSETLADVFEYFDFEDVFVADGACERVDAHDPEGIVCDLCFHGKSYDEDELLAVLAPFVAPGSYLVWIREDLAIAVNYFDGETVHDFDGYELMCAQLETVAKA